MSGRYFHNIKSTLSVPPEKLTSAASGHINGTLYKVFHLLAQSKFVEKFQLQACFNVSDKGHNPLG